MFTCTKTYKDIPFAHRQHMHEGHCKFIHGHNWALKFTFGCTSLDENGFVVDFGKLQFIQSWIEINLDHAFVFNAADTLASDLVKSTTGMFKPYPVESCSAEGLAKHLFSIFRKMVSDETIARVHLISVEVMEDSKNTATFQKGIG